MADETPTPETENVDEQTPDEGPAVEELEDDPAYNPDDEKLKRIKGG